MQNAMRDMVGHLASRDQTRGRPPEWFQRASELHASTKSGSLVFEFARPPAVVQPPLEDLGQMAFDALRDWDGSDDSSVPREIGSRFRAQCRQRLIGYEVWLGTEENPRCSRIRAPERPQRTSRAPSETAAFGWLREVNWATGTAQLHDGRGGYISLRFTDELGTEMLRFANRYVEIHGTGTIGANDQWSRITVQQIAGDRSWREPFDVAELTGNGSPRIFDPQTVVRASEPFDVDDYMRVIREGRDA